MSTDKWATLKSTQLPTKVWVKLLITWFPWCCVSYLNKAGIFTYYSKSDAHYFHIILNKNVVLNYYSQIILGIICQGLQNARRDSVCKTLLPGLFLFLVLNVMFLCCMCYSERGTNGYECGRVWEMEEANCNGSDMERVQWKWSTDENRSSWPL